MRQQQATPLTLSKDEFTRIGHQLINELALLYDTLPQKNVTSGEQASALQTILGNDPLPVTGNRADVILQRATDLLVQHSLFNGHPKFLGYITSSPTPIGAIADLLAAAINPNAGAQVLSPMATEIEKQTIRWLAQFIGYDDQCGGILVSGGNMANFTCFLAGRTAMAPKKIKEEGLQSAGNLLIYCSRATHTWIEKAAVLFGHGTNAIRWIDTDEKNRILISTLEQTINQDKEQGHFPIMVIGTAGDVSTGAVDDLQALADICKKYSLWFHVDGVYGAPAAVLPELQSTFTELQHADSIALDPHKWLYSPLEAGCALVKNPQHLLDTFSAHPAYYNFDNKEEPRTLNFYEYGLQNSRGFRALKVWMALQQAGKEGYITMIRDDMALANHLYKLAMEHPELQAITQSLSITTLRYIPLDLTSPSGDAETYLNELNEVLLNELQQSGELFLSNALVNGKYCMRACVVNFRTTQNDIEEIITIIVSHGRQLHKKLTIQQKTSDLHEHV